MKIPVFHDDQHGTAIIVGAACPTACRCCNGKTLADVKLVVSGAGAAALACVDLLVDLGLRARTSGSRHRRRRLRRPRNELMDPGRRAIAQRPTRARWPR
jgi:malate dehydrogenase (oxaloacetate-decarboxylating)(NADP+)